MAEQQVSVRPIRATEYEAVAELTERAYRDSYGALHPGYVASLRDVAAHVARGQVLVAEDAQGTLVGTVWVAGPDAPLAPVARAGEVDFRLLAVAPQARGRGVARAIIAALVELSGERGATKLVLNTGPDMHAAQALYERLGFHRLPEREGPVTVEEGRTIELLAYGLDLER